MKVKYFYPFNPYGVKNRELLYTFEKTRYETIIDDISRINCGAGLLQ